MNWRLIADAPKDGKAILLWERGLYVGYWDQRDGGWVDYHSGEPLDDEQIPTHWMPHPGEPGMNPQAGA